MGICVEKVPWPEATRVYCEMDVAGQLRTTGIIMSYRRPSFHILMNGFGGKAKRRNEKKGTVY
jgi:hypothetical protein